jgi:Activator of Hsp90 ATPase homolog 1-like protein
MNKTTKTIFQVQIRGSMQAVWRELTKQGEAQAAVFNAWLHVQALQVGAKMQMRTANGRNVMVVGRITRFEPMHCFAHTLRFTQYEDPECEVIYELKEVAGVVECTLTIERMPLDTRTAKDMQGGGKLIVETLKEVVETGRPKWSTRLMYALFARMGFVLPKSTRAEKWPL